MNFWEFLDRNSILAFLLLGPLVLAACWTIFILSAGIADWLGQPKHFVIQCRHNDEEPDEEEEESDPATEEG